MKEKLLALLVAKFAGMRKDGLAQLAASLTLQVEKEEEATVLVEKLTQEKVDSFIKDWRKDVDKEVSDANKTFEGNLKKKYELVEKKDPDPGKTDPQKPDTNDIQAIIKAAVEAAVNPLKQELAGYKGQKTAESRLQVLDGKFKNVPDSYKQQRLSDAQLLVGAMDDAAFEEYSKKLDTDIAAFSQELADKGLAGHGKPIFGDNNDKGVSSTVASFIESQNGKGKDLGGKDLGGKQ